MNLLTIFLAIATSTIFLVNADELQSSSNEPSQLVEGIFRARLDHFRPLNQQRVNFTYHVNADFYNATSGGPLYIYLKDYRDYSTRWIESGLMVDIAQQTNAALLTIDYRYFGVNRPTPTASFEDLEYLTVEQILADIADFIIFIREDIGNSLNSPIILWGSGIGGSLAVWARSRFPHLVTAAWSSSGYLEPKVASYGPYDFFEYTFDIGDDRQCAYWLRSAYLIMGYLVENDVGEYLSERLNLCHPVDTTSEADVASLYELSIRAITSYIDQFHYSGVRAFCNDIEALPDDPLGSLARWFRYVYGDNECFDHSYSSMLEAISNSTWGSPGTIEGRRQWYYLQCTQVGSFLLADEYTWLPGSTSLDFHLQKCEDVFGADFELTNLEAAHDFLLHQFSRNVSNVVYTNGLFDPFRYFGRLYDVGGSGTVINMQFVSKSADLASQSVNDPEQVYDAKTEIRNLVTLWSNTS